MKKTFSKIFLLAISLAIIICGVIGFSVSAQDAEIAPDIISKNVMVDGNFCLMFAVDPATVAGDDVTIKIYDQLPSEGIQPKYTETKLKTESQYEDIKGDGTADDSVIVFTTPGVSAKDIGDIWYITTESNKIVSEVETYSVMEYAFERLYKNGTVCATEDDGKVYYQKEFYLDILEIGSSAQKLLVNLVEDGHENDRLPNEYIYVSIKDGTAEGLSYGNYGFVEKETKLTLTANEGANVPAWQVKTYNKYGVLTDTQSCTLGSTVTIAGNTVIVPDPDFGTTAGSYYKHLGAEIYNFDGYSFVYGTGCLRNSTDKYISYGNSNLGARENNGVSVGTTTMGTANIVAVDGRGNVLEFGKIDGFERDTRYSFPITDSANGLGNCIVFEADMLIKDSKFVYSAAGENKAEKLINFLITSNVNSASADNKLTDAGIYAYNTTVADNTTAYDPEALYLGKTASNYDDLKLEQGEWYNICIEAYADGTMKFYVNGTLSYEYKASAALDVSAANSFVIQLLTGLSPTTIQLDNLICTKIVKDASAE